MYPCPRIIVEVGRRDMSLSVARSVLSAEAACCAWLCAGGAGPLLRALAACAARAPLAVRLAYTLGNMAAADDQARLHVSHLTAYAQITLE